MSNFSLFPENLLLTWNEKPIVAKRFPILQLKRLALEVCQLVGKHAGKHGTGLSETPFMDLEL